MDRTVCLWNTLDGTIVQRMACHANLVVGVAFSPDGLSLATCSWDKLIKVWDVPSSYWYPAGDLEVRLKRVLVGHQQAVCSVCWCLEGGRGWLASGCRGGTIKLWDLRE